MAVLVGVLRVVLRCADVVEIHLVCVIKNIILTIRGNFTRQQRFTHATKSSKHYQ